MTHQEYEETRDFEAERDILISVRWIYHMYECA